MTREQWLEKRIEEFQDEGILSDWKLMKLMEYEDELKELQLKRSDEDRPTYLKYYQ